MALAAILACAEGPDSGASDAGLPDAVDADRDRSDCGRGTPPNACGGCAELGVTIGAPCDMSGSAPDGYCAIPVWQCDRQQPDEPVCDWTTPTPEVCDGLDNDCDTFVDEDFDLMNNPANCGQCGVSCATPNAVPGCVEGRCTIDHCEPGASDEDGIVGNGCEADCVADGGDTDACDGLDNDCDGFVDEDYVSVTCGVGECAAVSRCADGVETPCSPAAPSVEVETVCDGRDENCDGQVDEGIATPCTNDCGSGEFVCRNGEFPACLATTEAGEACVDIQFFCETIPLELELPLPTPEDELGVDVAFLFDRSGSFLDDLDTFRSKATELTSALAAEIENLDVGLSSFIDAPCAGFGSMSDFAYEMNLALTDDLAQLETVLGTLDIGSGLDTPECQLEAMYQALTGQGHTVTRGDSSCRGVADIPVTDLGWRERALSFLFVSTDATFHQPDNVGYPYPHGAEFVIDAAAERGTRIYFLQAGGVSDPDAGLIADATGGAVFTLSSDSREIVDTVTSAILDALTDTEVELHAEGDDLRFVTDIFPERLTGVDLLTNSTLNVSVTLLSTVDATGEVQDYDFDLVFTVNGSEIARRPVSVTIPAEDPKDCSNRPPIIRTLGVPDQMLAGGTTDFDVGVDDPDGDALSYRWEVSGGTLVQPGERESRYGAPGAPGIVDVAVTVTDAAGNSDRAEKTVYVAFADCTTNARFLDLGLTSGRMVLNGALNQNLATGTCGGDGAEALLVLHVYRTGTYRFAVEGEGDFLLHLRERDCITEIACVEATELEVDLEEGSYLLFVDTPSSVDANFRLYGERLEP